MTDHRHALSLDADLIRLKWIAVVLMTSCHLMLTRPYPENGIGLFLGATVFPSFAAMIVIHLATDPDRRARRYLISLAVAGALAECPYLLLNGWTLAWPPELPLNALVTFFCAVALCRLYDRRRYVILGASLIPLIALGRLGLDGSMTAPLAMLVGFAGLRAKLWHAPMVFAIITLALAINDLVDLSSFYAKCHLAGLALMPAIYFLGKVPLGLPSGPRLFFYAYYPGHLLAVWLLMGAYPWNAGVADDRWLNALYRDAAPSRPGQSREQVIHDAALRRGAEQLDGLTGTQRSRMAAEQFLGFYLINVRTRPAYCRQHGSDIAPWTGAFVRLHAEQYRRAREILSRDPAGADAIEATLYRQLADGFETAIADAMASMARQLRISETAVCQAFARNGPKVAESMRLEIANPALNRALSDSP